MPENVKVDEPMFPSDETDDDQDDEEEENDDSFEEDDNQHEDDEDASDSDDPVVNEARVNRKVSWNLEWTREYFPNRISLDCRSWNIQPIFASGKRNAGGHGAQASITGS